MPFEARATHVFGGLPAVRDDRNGSTQCSGEAEDYCPALKSWLLRLNKPALETGPCTHKPSGVMRRQCPLCPCSGRSCAAAQNVAMGQLRTRPFSRVIASSLPKLQTRLTRLRKFDASAFQKNTFSTLAYRNDTSDIWDLSLISESEMILQSRYDFGWRQYSKKRTGETPRTARCQVRRGCLLFGSRTLPSP
jgi:hypothetical protein